MYIYICIYIFSFLLLLYTNTNVTKRGFFSFLFFFSFFVEGKKKVVCKICRSRRAQRFFEMKEFYPQASPLEK